MGNGRRGVKFSHRKGNGSIDARRASFSEHSEPSQDGSPTKTRSSQHMDQITEKDSAQPQQSDYEKKKQNFITRTIWTLLMIGGFFAALFMGHIYIILIITIIQIISFKEVIAIASVPSRARQLRSTKSLNWYWLASTMYFLYGESVIYYFKHVVLVDKVLLPLATHHRFISFILYIIGKFQLQFWPWDGFVFFVGSLKAGHLKFQFTQFAWTHMALLIIVVEAHFIMNNVFEGLIWFFLPAALVITNDIFAYICGITFGRTQLIKLSPKKTVEGFVGAWVFTVIFGYGLTNLMMRSGYFICPATDFGANVFTGLHCDPNPVFVPHTYKLLDFFFVPDNMHFSLTTEPMQIHTMIFATFASLIAPFGGFFASGLKRTFKIKDFGHSIPGHGGMTDRMDCQFIMGFFTFMYYHSFIAIHKVGLGDVMEVAINGLTVDEQVELVRNMARYLGNQGAVGSSVLSCLDQALPTRR